jgi:hypothetical protein
MGQSLYLPARGHILQKECKLYQQFSWHIDTTWKRACWRSKDHAPHMDTASFPYCRISTAIVIVHGLQSQCFTYVKTKLNSAICAPPEMNSLAALCILLGKAHQLDRAARRVVPAAADEAAYGRILKAHVSPAFSLQYSMNCSNPSTAL